MIINLLFLDYDSFGFTVTESPTTQMSSSGGLALSADSPHLPQPSSNSQTPTNKAPVSTKSPTSAKSTGKSTSAKKSSKNKNKKIVCICRTPFDDTK